MGEADVSCPAVGGNVVEEDNQVKDKRNVPEIDWEATFSQLVEAMPGVLSVLLGKKLSPGILSQLSEIEKSSFEPKMNPLCDWCQYQPYCPLYKHKYIKEHKTADSKQIKDIIREYFEIKAKQGESNKRISELKEEINLYCDKNEIDRIFGDEGYITRLSQQRFNYDSEKLKLILEPLGKWNEILTVDKAKFKKVIDSLPNNIKKEIEKTKTLGKEFKVISAKKN